MTLTEKLAIIGTFVPGLGVINFLNPFVQAFALRSPTLYKKTMAVADDPISAIVNLVKKKHRMFPHGRITLCQNGG